MKPPDDPQNPPELIKPLLQLVLWFAGAVTLVALLIIAVLFVFFHAHL